MVDFLAAKLTASFSLTPTQPSIKYETVLKPLLKNKLLIRVRLYVREISRFYTVYFGYSGNSRGKKMHL